MFAQRIVAWNAATTIATDLVMTPLRMALWQRDREGHPVEPKSLISHLDAGSQYTSVALTERLHDGPDKTLADVEYATAEWVEWYNNDRLHSTLGCVPPIEFEQA